jgi:hypothetical protein
MRRMFRFLVAAAVLAAGVSCGNVARQGRAPVYLVIDKLEAAPGNAPDTFGSNLLSDVLTIVTTGGSCTTSSPCPTRFNDLGRATLRAPLKDIGTTSNPATPTTNNDVTINQIHIEYVRADGRNTPGVDVPYPWDGAATGTIPAGGTLDLAFELVRNVAKEEPPLAALATNGTIITTIAQVTFYGHDTVGNAVSVTGSLQVDFGNFADKQ